MVVSKLFSQPSTHQVALESSCEFCHLQFAGQCAPAMILGPDNDGAGHIQLLDCQSIKLTEGP